MPGPAEIWVGTSGYVYRHWRKGVFYPAGLPARAELAYYGSRFRTVELNNPFYRLPTAEMFQRWRDTTPEGFQFAVKASRYITHIKRLREVGDELQLFLERADHLGSKLGPILFQLPPNFQKNADVLRAFVELFPEGTRAAFEFRHTSWLDAETYDILRSRNVALCIADSEKMTTPIEVTADYAYFRLRDEGYQQPDIDRWATTIRRLPVADAFVYFKHEEQGLGPEFARRLMDRLTPQS